MTVQQFESVNGFSNAFSGWGGEDDDLSNRFDENRKKNENKLFLNFQSTNKLIVPF